MDKMIAILISNLPVAILNSILIMPFFWLLYQFVKVFFKLSARKLYQLSFSGIVLAFVFFIANIFSNSIFNVLNWLAVHPYVNSTIFKNFSNHRWSIFVLEMVSYTYFLFLISFIIKCFFQFQSLGKLTATANFSRSSYFNQLLMEVAGSVNAKTNIGISDHITVPIVYGFFENIILIPASLCNHLTPQEIKLILAHEWSHINRNDYLMNLFIEIFSFVLWFNPITYLFKKEIQLQREVDCDASVLSNMNEPIGYSKLLLKIAENAILPKRNMGLAAFTSKNELKYRIERIHHLQTTYKGRFTFITSCFFVFGLFLCASYVNIHFVNSFQKVSKSTLVNYSNSNILGAKEVSIFEIKSNQNTTNNKVAIITNSSTHIVSHTFKLKKKNRYAIPLNINKSKPMDQEGFAKVKVLDSNNMILKKVQELSYADLVAQTKRWIKSHENPFQYASHDLNFENISSKDAIEESLANELILVSIVKKYQWNKSLLEQKIQHITDPNEARDFVLNSKEWLEMIAYEKWLNELFNTPKEHYLDNK